MRWNVQRPEKKAWTTSLLSRPISSVVDLKMPGIDGLDFARQAKEIVPDGQIVILTGYGDMNSAVEAMRAGAYGLPHPNPLTWIASCRH